MTNSSGAPLGPCGYVLCQRCGKETDEISTQTIKEYAICVACRHGSGKIKTTEDEPQVKEFLTGRNVMTVAEVAKLLGHAYTSRAYDLIKKKRLKAVDTKDGVKVDEASVKAYMKQRDERRADRKTKKATTKKTTKAVKTKKPRAVPKPSAAKKAKKAAEVVAPAEVESKSDAA